MCEQKISEIERKGCKKWHDMCCNICMCSNWVLPDSFFFHFVGCCLIFFSFFLMYWYWCLPLSALNIMHWLKKVNRKGKQHTELGIVWREKKWCQNIFLLASSKMEFFIVYKSYLYYLFTNNNFPFFWMILWQFWLFALIF